MKMKKIIAVVVLTLVTALSTGQLFAIVYANHTCKTYNACDPESGNKESTGTSPNIGELIITGAGHFLRSHADMLLFLQKMELSELNGPDYPGMQALINSALENMEKASNTYKMLIAAAEETPYNQDVIAKIMLFDYEHFKEEKGLNSVIFARIEKLLVKGNVTGLYVLLKADMDSITRQLYALKANVDTGTFPGLSPVWSLNRTYSESMLTGQYISEVFLNF
jgi:hypothetical protein